MKSTKCEFCYFGPNAKEHAWEIELYKAGSYKYEGYKYFLEVTYPYYTDENDLRIKPVEVFYCPKCGRNLHES